MRRAAAFLVNRAMQIAPSSGTGSNGRSATDTLDGMRDDGLGARTRQHVHATIRAALEHAVREELVSRNVAKLVRVERPKPAQKEPLSVEEVS